MRLRSLYLFTMALLAMASVVSADDVADGDSASIGDKVPIALYQPVSLQSTRAIPPVGVLLLIPGYNGSGEAMLDDRWRQFADQNSLILVAPTFKNTNPEELHQNRGYYYPEQGSGEQVEKALEKVHLRTGVQVDHLLIFGFSAGAHFAHRFALWKPEQVAAFVAYSAGWWSDPMPSLRTVPALIMCGETDPRYEATLNFMEKGLALHLPWIWRSYKNTDHQLTSPVRSMAESFLAYEAAQLKSGNALSKATPDRILYGDIQTYQVVTASEKESIPEEVRIQLPSQQIASIWQKEN